MKQQFFLIFASAFFFVKMQARDCSQSETRYTLTECDQGHGRWRIRVPSIDSCQLAKSDMEEPKRITSCDTFCPPGKYYDINGDLQCHDCQPGTYSLGASEEFTSWSKLPDAFRLDVAVPSTDQSGYYETLNETEAVKQCHEDPSTRNPNSLELRASSCIVILSYAASLVRDGHFAIAYRHTDSRNNFLSVQIENSACQRSRDKERSYKLEPTKSTEWKVFNVSLTTGTSVISLWLERAPISSDAAIVPVLVKNVTVSGMAYTSECKKCPNGTFSSDSNTARCSLCPVDTFAGQEGSTQCKRCGQMEFSEPGSDKCTPKKPCSKDDYFTSSSGCDQYGETTLTYEWFTPKRCSEDLPGAVRLPQPVKQKCPHCNPGQYYNKTMDKASGKEVQFCAFCPEGTFNDGSEPACKPCAKSSYSVSGIFWRLWRQNFPKDLVSNYCDGGEEACASAVGWQANDDNLQTVVKHASTAYSVLSLRIDRVRRPVKMSLNFETECDDACVLIIATTPNAELNDGEDFDMVFKSVGGQKRLWRTFEITSTPPFTLHIMFRKLTAARYHEILSETLKSGSLRLPTGPFDTNVARIYQMNLTNVEPGGMAECYDCNSLNPQPSFCKICQAGSARTNDTVCRECLKDYITPPVKAETTSGELSFIGEHSDTCQACPQHMRAAKSGLSCYSDCKFNHTSGSTTFHYDLSSLGLGVASSLPMFLPSGTKYLSTFNVTLCGDGAPTICQRGRAPSLETLSAASSPSSSSKQAAELSYGMSRVCSATVIQPKNQVWTSKIIGSRLVSITFGEVSAAVRLANLSAEVAPIFNSSNLPASGYSQIPDIVFTFQGDEKSDGCPNGAVTAVVARCDPRSGSASSILLPQVCPSGSCDNCHYLLLWTSYAACPGCDDKELDYEIVNGECSFGSQTVYRYPKQHCLLMGKEREVLRTQSCNPLPLAAQISLVLIIALVVILAIVLLYTCKRTKKLEYRYMKLVESTGLDESELPQAESCAVEVDAPDDQDQGGPSISQEGGGGAGASGKHASGAASGTSKKMERMRIGGTKVKKFRTIETDDDRRRGVNSAFFEAAESPQMESLMTARPSVL